ncbi:MAG: transcription antitermination protein NusB [Flavobacteriales bacterium]|nr:transcription antitermination protein NusB [Flavobacteriales bacterium]
MLNRRHIRIKILHALYAYEQSEDSTVARAEKELFYSIKKMYEMYLYLMLLMTELQAIAEQRVEEGKKKRLPSEDDLNPNLRFVNNRFIKQLNHNKELENISKKEGVNWSGEPELLRRLYKMMIDTEEYRAYMTADEDSYEKDREVVLRLFKRHLINHESLQDFFDEQSIFWADDLDLVASMVLKTFKSFDVNSDEFHPLLPLWKDPEDELEFVKVLFRKTITQGKEHLKLIKDNADNWEIERIALMDILLMKMALTEAREFKQIPVKVTLNEYIEISKYYSTPKSNNFINGVLDKLFAKLKDDGTIKKVGRGLIS